ncbi:MAG: hypothetical protein V2I43_23955, partial [Parvularcula sp.]|nr:hypothetical protein [Parvularcula sp.]
FSSNLSGAEVTGTSTSVLSTGGLAGASAVSFIITGADNCTAIAPCTVSLPVNVTDGANVTATVGLETDAGAPVQGTDEETRESVSLVTRFPAFAITVAADTTPSTADLDLTSPFTAFDGGSDNILGAITVDANFVDTDGDTVADTTVNVDLGANPVDASDVESIDVAIVGNFSAFDPATPAAAPAGDFQVGGDSVTVDGSEGTVEITPVAALPVGPLSVVATPDGTSAIQRSTYAATVTVDVTDDLDVNQVAAGALQSIDREGTSVIFPWTASASQSAASGSTNIIRIGNIASGATGAVFASALSSTTGVPTTAVQVAASVPANGELLLTSSDLEAALGNFGRADIEITVEEDSANITARRFIVRDSGIQSLDNGTVAQNN